MLFEALSEVCLDLFGRVWICLDFMWGPVWTYLDLFGLVWILCLELFEPVWTCVDLFGPVWMWLKSL